MTQSWRCRTNKQFDWHWRPTSSWRPTRSCDRNSRCTYLPEKCTQLPPLSPVYPPRSPTKCAQMPLREHNPRKKKCLAKISQEGRLLQESLERIICVCSESPEPKKSPKKYGVRNRKRRASSRDRAPLAFVIKRCVRWARQSPEKRARTCFNCECDEREPSRRSRSRTRLNRRGLNRILSDASRKQCRRQIRNPSAERTQEYVDCPYYESDGKGGSRSVSRRSQSQHRRDRDLSDERILHASNNCKCDEREPSGSRSWTRLSRRGRDRISSADSRNLFRRRIWNSSAENTQEYVDCPYYENDGGGGSRSLSSWTQSQQQRGRDSTDEQILSASSRKRYTKQFHKCPTGRSAEYVECPYYESDGDDTEDVWSITENLSQLDKDSSYEGSSSSDYSKQSINQTHNSLTESSEEYHNYPYYDNKRRSDTENIFRSQSRDRLVRDTTDKGTLSSGYMKSSIRPIHRTYRESTQDVKGTHCLCDIKRVSRKSHNRSQLVRNPSNERILPSSYRKRSTKDKQSSAIESFRGMKDKCCQCTKGDDTENLLEASRIQRSLSERKSIDDRTIPSSSLRLSLTQTPSIAAKHSVQTTSTSCRCARGGERKRRSNNSQTSLLGRSGKRPSTNVTSVSCQCNTIGEFQEDDKSLSRSRRTALLTSSGGDDMIPTRSSRISKTLSKADEQISSTSPFYSEVLHDYQVRDSSTTSSIGLRKPSKDASIQCTRQCSNSSSDLKKVLKTLTSRGITTQKIEEVEERSTPPSLGTKNSQISSSKHTEGYFTSQPNSTTRDSVNRSTTTVSTCRSGFTPLPMNIEGTTQWQNAPPNKKYCTSTANQRCPVVHWKQCYHAVNWQKPCQRPACAVQWGGTCFPWRAPPRSCGASRGAAPPSSAGDGLAPASSLAEAFPPASREHPAAPRGSRSSFCKLCGGTLECRKCQRKEKEQLTVQPAGRVTPKGGHEKKAEISEKEGWVYGQIIGSDDGAVQKCECFIEPNDDTYRKHLSFDETFNEIPTKDGNTLNLTVKAPTDSDVVEKNDTRHFDKKENEYDESEFEDKCVCKGVKECVQKKNLTKRKKKLNTCDKLREIKTITDLQAREYVRFFERKPRCAPCPPRRIPCSITRLPH